VYLAALASQVLSASRGWDAGFEVLDVVGGPVLALGGGDAVNWGVG